MYILGGEGVIVAKSLWRMAPEWGFKLGLGLGMGEDDGFEMEMEIWRSGHRKSWWEDVGVWDLWG